MGKACRDNGNHNFASITRKQEERLAVRSVGMESIAAITKMVKYHLAQVNHSIRVNTH